MTTYGVMGRDAVDFALGYPARLRPSVTVTLPLVGAAGTDAAAAELAVHTSRFGWDARLTDHLMHRFCANVRDIVAMCEADPAMAQSRKPQQAVVNPPACQVKESTYPNAR